MARDFCLPVAVIYPIGNDILSMPPKLRARQVAPTPEKTSVPALSAAPVVPQSADKRNYIVCGCFDEGFSPSCTLVLRARSPLAIAQWMRDNFAANHTVRLLLTSISNFPYNQHNPLPPACTADFILQAIENSYVDGDSSMGVVIAELPAPLEI